MKENPADKVQHWDIDKLIPYARNSRTHSDEQVSQIAASMKEWGITSAVLVDEDGGIIAGHGRVMAAKKLGMTNLPVMVASGWTDSQKRAFVIADNKLALNAGWDAEMLALEVDELEDLGFDLSLTGFSDEELAAIEPEKIDSGLTDEDDVPEVPKEAVTRLGDIWILGNHRLMCGDATSIDSAEKLRNKNSVDMVYTDPPYGIKIVKGGTIGGSKPFGSVGGGKLAKVGSYQPIIGDDGIDTAIQSFQVIEALKPKVRIIWGGNYFAQHLENSSCWIVWDKDNTGNFADAELAWTNQKTAVRIFKHRWNGMLKASEHGQRRVHPTQKPIKLAEWCFDEYGSECETVLDLFGGSGSTLLAAEIKKKKCLLMELSENYCDVIVKRWQNFTGKKAVLESNGKTFDEVANG